MCSDGDEELLCRLEIDLFTPFTDVNGVETPRDGLTTRVFLDEPIYAKLMRRIFDGKGVLCLLDAASNILFVFIRLQFTLIVVDWFQAGLGIIVRIANRSIRK